ncbi:helix-turn-helix domain-containing protein [Vibrio rhodolitus]|uniref:helix-turn-helix domain-containing protein n=1 Tax=Vibrio rhodolitus TaxID=2231649 RepID=UPI000E0A9F30|nr:helix-turn-helix domain-containing protein [Vibrio rhodolitus]
MDISEVAKRSGIKASALRYYEKIGLIRSHGRVGLRRQYHPSVLEKLNLISLGKAANLSLEEIKAMFDGEKQLNINRPLLAAKAEQLNSEIKRLLAVRDSLEHVAQCPAENHLDCASFQKLIRKVSLTTKYSKETA